MEVTGPLGAKVESGYAIAGTKAIIEMADASGMKLVDTKQLNPLKASSIGTGELILDAIKKGCNEILLAIGGSATVDGGIGMMKALGFRFYDEDDRLLDGVGGDLSRVKKIEANEGFKGISFKIICDVDNPLLGENGAAHVFGPQKGATPEMVEELEKGLKNWGNLLSEEAGKDLQDIKGAGAAGGISLPLIAWFNAQMVPGANFVLNELEFDKHVQWADIVITGEGKIDSQTANNKAPYAVAQVAKKYNKPVLAIGGAVEGSISSVFNGVFSLVNGPVTLEYAMVNAKKLLYELCVELAKTMVAVRKV
jgi:glycerate kinase